MTSLTVKGLGYISAMYKLATQRSSLQFDYWDHQTLVHSLIYICIYVLTNLLSYLLSYWWWNRWCRRWPPGLIVVAYQSWAFTPSRVVWTSTVGERTNELRRRWNWRRAAAATSWRRARASSRRNPPPRRRRRRRRPSGRRPVAADRAPPLLAWSNSDARRSIQTGASSTSRVRKAPGLFSRSITSGSRLAIQTIAEPTSCRYFSANKKNRQNSSSSSLHNRMSSK